MCSVTLSEVIYNASNMSVDEYMSWGDTIEKVVPNERGYVVNEVLQSSVGKGDDAFIFVEVGNGLWFDLHDNPIMVDGKVLGTMEPGVNIIVFDILLVNRKTMVKYAIAMLYDVEDYLKYKPILPKETTEAVFNACK